jgi:hypothetical protein
MVDHLSLRAELAFEGLRIEIACRNAVCMGRCRGHADERIVGVLLCRRSNAARTVFGPAGKCVAVAMTIR